MPALSVRMAVAASPSRTWLFAHCGSDSVPETTYFGSVLSFRATGSSFGSVALGHAAAKMS